ncbi:hypothetical protein AFCA_004837 [Aspergillus flavus]|nr:hypothetical protein AFCA_004837 [Aspergillus flavus]
MLLLNGLALLGALYQLGRKVMPFAILGAITPNAAARIAYCKTFNYPAHVQEGFTALQAPKCTDENEDTRNLSHLREQADNG